MQKSIVVILLFFLFCIKSIYAQKEICNVDSKYTLIPPKSFTEDYKLNELNVMDKNNEELSKYENQRTLIIQFYFDRTNKFNKSVEEFKTLLSESLPKKTDINIVYKFQKIEGSIFVKNGKENLSIIHLNALFYAKDKSLLNEIFGKGKDSRIDTTSTRLKNFTHEFVPFSNSSDELGYLFLYRGKSTGKGFACDPNEDVDILGTLKNIYDEKYIKKCEENEENKINQKLTNLETEHQKLISDYNAIKEEVKKIPTRWNLYSGVNFHTSSTSSNSSYFNQKINFNSNSNSNSIGVLYFIKDYKDTVINKFYLTAALSIGSGNFSMPNNIDFEYVKATKDYNYLVSLRKYNEKINSKFVNIPFGFGYEWKDKNKLPVFFQFSVNGVLGFNTLSSNYASGTIDYRRYYPSTKIIVNNQPQKGLEDNVELNGKPKYNEILALSYGASIDTKILYNFNKLPLNAYLNLGYLIASTTATSNGSDFISRSKNDFNSILNSFDNFGSSPFYVGFGISYELRKIIRNK
jgi:hypothetical protein